ncbi:MAG TPA: hypothetical protein VG944_13110 [Fimbriimonas sp.]|nr:hypothetical protein [Fimbriimonas sp.]
MSDAGKITVPLRKRGPKGMFDDPVKQHQLAVFLMDPKKTNADAAREFHCSQSLIEKVLKKMRSPVQESTPSQPDAQGESAA